VTCLWRRRVLPTDCCAKTNGWFVWLLVAAASVGGCRSVTASVPNRAWIPGGDCGGAVGLPDIRKLSEKLYKGLAAASENLDKALAGNGVAKFRFDDSFLTQYSKPLAILEKRGFIQGTHSIGGRDFDAVYLHAPEYFVYLCALYEDQTKMDRLVELLETCKRREWLLGEKIAGDVQLPLPVVRAFFPEQLVYLYLAAARRSKWWCSPPTSGLRRNRDACATARACA